MPTTQSPLVSVVIPAFNAERFLRRTLDSVLSQTYRNMEVLVVNDGSADGTEAIALEYCQRDPRVKILNQDNQGVAAARNRGIVESCGEFIAPLDADDVWYPEKINAQVHSLLDAGHSAALSYSWAFVIDESEKVLGAFGSRYEGDVFLDTVLLSGSGNSSCRLIRRSSLESVGLYDTSFRSMGAEGCEDWDLDIRLSRRFRFVCVPRYLVGYRMVSQSMSKNARNMHKSCIAVLEKTRQAYPELPPCVSRWRRSAIDFMWSGVLFEQGHHLKGLELLLSSIARDIPRLLWLLSFPVHIRHNRDRFERILGIGEPSSVAARTETECIDSHQSSLERPYLFRRLNYNRLERLKRKIHQAGVAAV